MDGPQKNSQSNSKSFEVKNPNLFDPTAVSISVSILFVLLSIILYLWTRKSTRKSIVLIGLADSGKTALFTNLAHNAFTSTVTSMKENEEVIPVKGGHKVATLIDLPGYDRLRSQFWDKFKTRACGIIYVVDSASFMSNLHIVADLLYQYLIDDFVVSKRIPFLIACTKQDETRAKTAKVISSLLEKEFNTIRETRLGALDTTVGDENTRKVLGNTDGAFSFNDLPNSVEFVDCNATSESNNREAILNWIDTIF